MAASVLFACGLNEQKLPSFVHISEESNVDSSFLVSSILGQRLRISNAGTVLVCLQHNYTHYFHAGMRLGYNTNIFNDKTLHIVDPLTEMARNGITSKWLRDERRLTATLLDAIRDHINASVTQRINTTVLIDNLAILLNLGATKEEIVLLCHDLAELPKQYENLTVITKMSNCDLYEPLDNNVAKLGTLRIRAAHLPSGVSRDVDGKLVIEREVVASNGGGGIQKNSSTKQVIPDTIKEAQQQVKQPIQVVNSDDMKDEMCEKIKDTNQQSGPEEDLKDQEQLEDSVEKMELEAEESQTPEKKEQENEEEEKQYRTPEKIEVKQNPKKQKQDVEMLQNDGYALEVVRKEVLYKVHDRNIKILSPGEVGVKV